PQEYVVTRTFTATDDCGNASTAVQVITVVDTTAPEFTSIPEDVTIECDAEVPSMMAEATDNCGEVTVTSSDVSDGDNCETVIIRTFTATDECGNVATAEQVITIVDTTAPVVEGIIEIDMPCDNVDTTPQITATDNCNEVNITFEDTPVSGGCAGRIIRDYVVSDACGNITEFQQIITLIDETAPEFTQFPEDVTVNCDEIPSLDNIEVAFEDNCADSLDLVYVGEEIVGEGCEYQIVRTWTLTDPCENVTTAVWTITVVDDEAPVIGGEDFEETVSCDAVIELPQYDASDNCDEDVELEMSMETIEGDCPQNYTEVYTWTATDDCGNSSQRVVTINYVDEEAPVFDSVPGSNEISCEDDLPSDMATASDNCGEVTVTFNDVIVDGDCPNNYTVVRTWTATDECGNSSTATTEYYVYDFTAPVFDGEVEDVEVQCADDVPAVADISATDNCGTATVTSSIEVIEEDECGNGVSIVTLVASDECGNTSEISYSVTVNDTTAPEIVGAPEDLVLDCEDDVPAAPEVTAVDNCDGDVEVTYTEEFIGEDEPAEGSTSDCIGTNPQDASPAWSLWLQDLENGLDYYTLQGGATANWVTYPDGSAHLTGTVRSTQFPARAFVIDVWFENGMDWDSWSTQPFPTSYKDDEGFAEDDMLYEDWTYYIMNSDSATLTGIDAYAGSFLNLSHAPSSFYFGFQEGQGANNRSEAYGIGGWFYYEGTLVGPDYQGPVDGAGDFAFELDCCPQYEIVRTWTAVDCSGNVTTVSQTITFEDLPDDPGQNPELEDSVYDAQKGDIVINGLAPNPSKNVSYLEFTSKSNQQVTIAISDMAGNQVDVVFEGNVEAGVKYRQQLNTTYLESGLYLVRLVGSTDATYTKLVVGK
ncbi:HYR-like domain-containing protein, partial [Halocola ammonii]